jgi:hypothetical protein
MFWDGERIEKAVVSATPGKPSEVRYISESGKEISKEQLVMAGLIIK